MLFDGKTTHGWRGYRMTGFPANGWRVKDGCLENPATNGRPNGGGGDLLTVDRFGDFDFRWEWRISHGGNSGVYYFTRERTTPGFAMYRGDDGTAAVGYEYQLLDDATHPDGKNPSHRTASLYDVIAPQNAAPRPVGEFNQSRILLRGSHGEHWLNGVKVVEYDLQSPEFREAVGKSKFRVVPDFATKQRAPLLLQDHGDQVEFRDLKIRELSGD